MHVERMGLSVSYCLLGFARQTAPMRSNLPIRPSLRPLLAAPLGTLLIIGSVLATGCAARSPDRSGLFEPYRISIPQGNYVTKEMLAQVKPGMTPEQVRFALGTPLVQDVFHPNRWDYVFRFQRASGRADQRHATVYFDNGKVVRVEETGLPERDDPNDAALPGARLPQETSR